MHVVFRESHGLDETDTPTDLQQTSADLVVLSFSDSDLGAFAAGWHRARDNGTDLPTLRLANLAALKHPLSVDTYIEQTLDGAKGILIRLIGGVPYWSYGLQQVEVLARAKGIALAVIPADGRVDTRLDEISTLPVSTLRRLTYLSDEGGAIAAQAALAQLTLAAGLYASVVPGAKALPAFGMWTPEQGVIAPAEAFPDSPLPLPRILIAFYRAYLSAADLHPIKALFTAFRARGFDVAGIFAPSLKAAEATDWLAEQLRAMKPAAVVNATAFSGKGDDGTSPLDHADVPVFQVALATSDETAWAKAERGLSPADLAMHVVLPEVDGRIFAGVISFKEPGQRDPDLQFSHNVHRAHPDRINAVADRVRRWVDLAQTNKPPALILSTYPGKDWQMAHAVGLDALASADAMLHDLGANGWDTQPGLPLENALKAETLTWSLADYTAALVRLPQSLQDDLATVWGDPLSDPACIDDHFTFAATKRGAAIIALQPERGTAA
ncbi:MAG: cobaltochelatase subunit CobN, partial [Rhodobacteraceae bacterium]|nr:cobaltochelatase subunit CobN [Paracoccaceae bacterium]